MRYWRGRQVKTGITDARFFSMSSLNIQQDSLLSPPVWLTAPHTIVPISFKIASLLDPQPIKFPVKLAKLLHKRFQGLHSSQANAMIKNPSSPSLLRLPNPTPTTMDLYPSLQTSPWHYFLSSPFLLPSYYSATPQNYVHWTETPDSHLFSADLPGMRKEEIRVEVEDSRYLVIRTECKDDSNDIEERERRSFMRKFRLPQMVDFDGISARFEDGVLTVTVPRMSGRRRLRLDPAEMAMVDNRVARAA